LTINALTQVYVYEDHVKILRDVPVLFSFPKIRVMSAQHGFIMARRVLFEKLEQFFWFACQVYFIITPMIRNGIFTQQSTKNVKNVSFKSLPFPKIFN
jgi:hypothetical protein